MKKILNIFSALLLFNLCVTSACLAQSDAHNYVVKEVMLDADCKKVFCSETTNKYDKPTDILVSTGVVTSVDGQDSVVKNIDIASDSVFEKNAGLYHYYVKCVVTNNLDEDLLTWYSAEPIDNQSDQRLINRYFGKTWGDFNMYSLLYEGLLSPHALSKIGVNFIKKIPVKHAFTYIFQTTEKFDVSHIVLLKRHVVEQYLKMALDDIWFYDSDEVLVNIPSDKK